MASVEGIPDLAEVDNECDQGVYLKSNLQFDKHVANICAKANRTVGINKHTFYCINVDMFQIFLKSLLRPILKYLSSAWRPYTKDSARNIEQIQRRATKMVVNSKNVSYSERLHIIGIPMIQFR